MKKKPIILVGSGGHAKACIDVVENEAKFYIYGIIDNKKKGRLLGYPKRLMQKTRIHGLMSLHKGL